MQRSWDKIELSELLTLAREPVEINPLKSYNQITIKLNHKGVVLRGETCGQAIKSKQYMAKQGQFIISKIDARNGAMGIVPKELDGAIVTSDFLTYDINVDRLHPKYLDYLTSTNAFVNECNRASKGTTNRVRLKPELFTNIEIPLPPLEEQQRIILTLEKIDKLKRLHEEVQMELDRLVPSFLQKVVTG